MTFLTVVMATAESAQPLTQRESWSLSSTYRNKNRFSNVTPNVNSILCTRRKRELLLTLPVLLTGFLNQAWSCSWHRCSPHLVQMFLYPCPASRSHPTLIC